MATETGGFAVTGSPENVQRAFERVRNETSNYYMLGYYAPNDARDGKFRKIEVRVKRPGLRVEARKGYTAPKGNAPARRAVETKEGTSPGGPRGAGQRAPGERPHAAGDGRAVQGIRRQRVGAGASSRRRGRDLKFSPKGDRFEDSVELSAVAVDKVGKTRGGERMQHRHAALREDARLRRAGRRLCSRCA